MGSLVSQGRPGVFVSFQVSSMSLRHKHIVTEERITSSISFFKLIQNFFFLTVKNKTYLTLLVNF